MVYAKRRYFSKNYPKIETLLLLLSLTQSNAEIQKIAAFESVFERLLVIIIDETLDGGIVIQDCLGLVCNLLRYNTSNQNLFRESGLIARVAGLCNSLDGKWDVQKECNVSLVLEVFRILCGGGSVNQVTFNIYFFEKYFFC